MPARGSQVFFVCAVILLPLASIGLRFPPSTPYIRARRVSSIVMSSTTTTAVWFRKSLRLHDNAALVEAAAKSSHVIPVFILDPWFATPANVGAVRFNFLLEALRDLDSRWGS